MVDATVLATISEAYVTVARTDGVRLLGQIELVMQL